jgi:hypothetical protein
MADDGAGQGRSNRIRSTLTGSDSNAVVEREHKNFTIANFSVGRGSASFNNRIDGRLDEIVVNSYL